MKFSEAWLRSMVDPALDSAQLAHALTMAGLEVELREPVAPPFHDVVVGAVQTVARHPHADRLSVCRVDVGESAVLTVVCGAPNVRPGIKAPCARVGAQLPGLGIKTANVRGVESQGMLCSARELGIAEDASGLLLLPQDAPLGADIRGYLDLDDHVFTLKLTPNRADCLSLVGVAREVEAITGATSVAPDAGKVPVGSELRTVVVLDAPQACPRYCGRVLHGVDPAAMTPPWMVRRLERSGLRSISAIVDITNYVMLELGQPLHAFDRAKLSGSIHVRYARDGERLALLNDQELALTSSLLVIADERAPVALAGIMGGRDSAVSETTTEVFLESAFFAPRAIAGKQRVLGFTTDSAYRFERGVDFSQTERALERASALLLEVCGGVAGPVVEAAGELPVRAPIRIRPARAQRMLGIALEGAEIGRLLRRLRFEVTARADELLVTPQSYRFDLASEEDLIEEVARIHGYENIAPALPVAAAVMLPSSESQRSRNALRELLVARDYHEMISFSFVDAQWERDFCANDAPIALSNPIASQLAVMRSTLAGSLVEALRLNLSRKLDRVRLFEIGRCFTGSMDAIGQPLRLGAICYGEAVPRQWGTPARYVDFYDVKADLEAFGAPARMQFEPASHPALHPGRSATVMIDGNRAGWLGELHPKWQQKYELPKAPLLFELDLERLLRRSLPVFTQVSNFPAVRRDIALVVDDSVSVQQLLDTFEAGKPVIVSAISLFDLYRGEDLGQGKKSLAFRVLLQDTQKTLTDAEVDSAVAHLKQLVQQKHQAKVRS